MAFEEHVVTSFSAIGMTVDPVWYQQPVFSFTNPNNLRGCADDVPMAPGSSDFDYELEIAAVIGREGADLTPEQAVGHIAGYVLFCDWSAATSRDPRCGSGWDPPRRRTPRRAAGRGC